MSTTPSDRAVEPLSPRSIVLSVLLGTHPPSMPVRRLLDFTSLFGIGDGTTRTALSRMVARGELTGDGGIYRLSGRLLERQAQQDAGRTEPSAFWDGTWWFAAVIADRRSVAERREFRSRVEGARFGELRADTWIRPANISAPLDLPDVVLTRGPLVTGDEEMLVHRLWDLEKIDHRARALRSLLQAAAANLSTVSNEDALAGAFVDLAAGQRFLRTEPQLPEPLGPSRSGAELRSTYAEVSTLFQSQLAAFFERRRPGG